MGVSLVGKEKDFYANWAGWRALLSLAYKFGWAPAGTVYNGEPEIIRDYPDEKEAIKTGVRTGYFGNDGRLVTDSDAASIAAALRRALSDPSAIGIVEKEECGGDDLTASRAAINAHRETPDSGAAAIEACLDGLELGDSRLSSWVEAFASLCEKGGFRIF